MSDTPQLSIPIDFNARTKDGRIRVHARRIPPEAAIGDGFVAFDPEDEELKVYARLTYFDSEKGVAHLELDWDKPVVMGLRTVQHLWFSHQSSAKRTGEVSGSRKVSVVTTRFSGFSDASNERELSGV